MQTPHRKPLPQQDLFPGPFCWEAKVLTTAPPCSYREDFSLKKLVTKYVLSSLVSDLKASGNLDYAQTNCMEPFCGFLSVLLLHFKSPHLLQFLRRILFCFVAAEMCHGWRNFTWLFIGIRVSKYCLNFHVWVNFSFKLKSKKSAALKYQK